MAKIFIACPANVATGGPELLHQLCYKLRKKGYLAYMYYFEFNKKNNNPVHPQYNHYGNDYIIQYVDSEENIIIVPEVMESIFYQAPLAKKIFWWLSVDNFIKARMWKFSRLWSYTNSLMLINSIIFLRSIVGKTYNISANGIIHLVQSQYALKYCEKIGIKENVYYLSDYISQDFFREAEKNFTKEDIVLYNPQKGYAFTKMLVKESPQFAWIPLVGLTRQQMIELLKKAKVYIDFGNHPGKDRIPREAAICGCCVITGMKGSAAYQEDVNIPQELKFEDKKENIPLIIKKIQEIFNDYEGFNERYDKYREVIGHEEKKFESDLSYIFSKLTKEE